ncbi:hypothetical protein [Streptomyces sp. NPDC002851]
MGILVQQLETAAHILEETGALVPVDVACALDQPSHIRFSTRHQLTLADQRSAVDRIAAVLGEVPAIQPVFTGRHGASVRGEHEGMAIIAVTDAAVPHTPLPERITTTAGTIAVLRAIMPWADSVEEHLQELVVCDASTQHSVHATVDTEKGAKTVQFGLVPEYNSGRRRQALLPTGHPLGISVIRA